MYGKINYVTGFRDCRITCLAHSIVWSPITIVGVVLGIKGMAKPEGKGMAIAGVVLCIIGLVLTIINASIGAHLGATGQLF